jgi:hypothetical protein
MNLKILVSFSVSGACSIAPVALIGGRDPPQLVSVVTVRSAEMTENE